MFCCQCVREILCKLSDHKDVDNAGEKEDRILSVLFDFDCLGRTTPTMSYIVSEKRIWRELVQVRQIYIIPANSDQSDPS